MKLPKKVNLRRKSNDGADFRDEFDTLHYEVIGLNKDGNAVSVPSDHPMEAMDRLGYLDNFPLLPAPTISATTDALSKVSATEVPQITRPDEGGVNLETTDDTTAAAGDTVILQGQGVFAGQTIRTNDKLVFKTRARIPSDTGHFFSAGLNESDTDADPSGTAGDGASFVYDPTGALSHGLSGDDLNNWIIHYKVAGADTWEKTSVPVSLTADHVLEIEIDDDLRPVFWIDGSYVATGDPLTDGDALNAVLGLELTGTTRKNFSARYLRMARNIG